MNIYLYLNFFNFTFNLQGHWVYNAECIVMTLNLLRVKRRCAVMHKMRDLKTIPPREKMDWWHPQIKSNKQAHRCPSPNNLTPNTYLILSSHPPAL